MTMTDKPTTAAKAIRQHCLWCCCENSHSVSQCPANTCAVHAYRRGFRDQDAPALTRLKSIRARCLDCVGTAHAVSACEITTCDLFPFRFGKNPHRPPMTDEQKAAARERMAKINGARTTEAA